MTICENLAQCRHYGWHLEILFLRELMLNILSASNKKLTTITSENHFHIELIDLVILSRPMHLVMAWWDLRHWQESRFKQERTESMIGEWKLICFCFSLRKKFLWVSSDVNFRMSSVSSTLQARITVSCFLLSALGRQQEASVVTPAAPQRLRRRS